MEKLLNNPNNNKPGAYLILSGNECSLNDLQHMSFQLACTLNAFIIIEDCFSNGKDATKNGNVKISADMLTKLIYLLQKTCNNDPLNRNEIRKIAKPLIELHKKDEHIIEDIYEHFAKTNDCYELLNLIALKEPEQIRKRLSKNIVLS